MHPFSNVLLVSQGRGDDTESVRQVLGLSQTGTAVTALIATPAFPKSLATYNAAWEQSLLDNLKRSIESCASELQITPAPVIPATVESGKASADRIIRHVLRHGIDLLIKQAEPFESRSGFSALDMQLLRQCPCPVWLCRPMARPRKEIQVAVAIDAVAEDATGHGLGMELLKASRALADTFSGTLTVISCWHYEFEENLRHNPWFSVPQEELSRIVGNAELEHRTALDAMLKESRIGGSIQMRRLKGRPDEMIPKAVVESQIDILVMGSVARTGLPGFLMGNTAENVLRQLYSSLVVLKPRGFTSSVSAYD